MALLMPVARPPHAGKALGAERTQDVYIPLKLPLDSARHAPGTGRGYSYSYLNAEMRMNDEP
jgi:hypothetical protein